MPDPGGDTGGEASAGTATLRRRTPFSIGCYSPPYLGEHDSLRSRATSANRNHQGPPRIARINLPSLRQHFRGAPFSAGFPPALGTVGNLRAISTKIRRDCNRRSPLPTRAVRGTHPALPLNPSESRKSRTTTRFFSPVPMEGTPYPTHLEGQGDQEEHHSHADEEGSGSGVEDDCKNTQQKTRNWVSIGARKDLQPMRTSTTLVVKFDS